MDISLVIEQICPHCGKRMDSGTTWTEANKCPQCGANVAEYKPYGAYYSVLDGKGAQESIARYRQRFVDGKPAFIGLVKQGVFTMWKIGPVEVTRA